MSDKVIVIETEAVETEAVETEAVETEAVETEAVETEAVETEAVETGSVSVDGYIEKSPLVCRKSKKILGYAQSEYNGKIWVYCNSCKCEHGFVDGAMKKTKGLY